MNKIKARCGHYVIAEGAPYSSARRAQEARHCGLPRCESNLPKKFTDRECAAYVWMWDKPPWTVDLLTKRVKTPRNEYANLIEFAQKHGWGG